MNLKQFLLATPSDIFSTFISKACDRNLEFVYKNNTYLWIKGKSNIALTAHVDTFDVDYTKGVDSDKMSFQCTKPKEIVEEYGIIVAYKDGVRCILGGDDRVGVHMCYEHLSDDNPPHILLFNGEEVGGIGSNVFVMDNIDLPDFDIMISLDACYNNEFVWYGSNRSADEWVQSYGWKNRGKGIFTDIQTVGHHYKFPCVNLGVGYFNQHTEQEYIDVEIMEMSKRKLTRMLADGVAKEEYCYENKVKFMFSIESDDDFYLDSGFDFEVTGINEKEARSNAIRFLEDIKLSWVKTYSVSDENGTKRGDYSHAWYTIRDAAIEALRDGEDEFYYGGNQTIDFCKINGKYFV